MTNTFEIQLQRYFDGGMSKAEEAAFVREVQSDPVKQTLFDQHRAVEDALANHGEFLAPPLHAERSLAKKIPILAEMNPLLQPVASTSIGSTFFHRVALQPAKWIGAALTTAAVVTGVVFIFSSREIGTESLDRQRPPSASERVVQDERERAELNSQDEALRPNKSSTGSRQASIYERSEATKLDTKNDVTLEAESNRSYADDLQQTAAVPIEDRVRSVSDFSPIDFPTGSAKETIETTALRDIKRRDDYLTQRFMPVLPSGLFMSLEQGISATGFGGTFGASRAVREMYRVNLQYQLSRSMTVAAAFGRTTMLRHAVAYESIPTNGQQTPLYFERVSEQQFAFTHADLSVAYTINPHDDLFFSLQAGGGLSLSGSNAQLVTAGLTAGYKLNPYVAVLAGLHYRGMFLTPTRDDGPTAQSGQPIGIIRTFSGNDSYSSSFELRFGFGFALW